MKNLMAAGFLLLAGGSAWAGPNGGGTLIIHNTGALYASGSLPCSDGTDPLDCTQAVTRVEVESAESPAIFRVYAAFPASRSPRLMGVTWGVSYDPARLAIAGHDDCADFELPDAGWPGSGSGNSLVWNTLQTGHIVKLYGFYAYAYSQAACTFVLTPSPSQGGYFGDDAVPAFLDPIAGFSTLGFHTDGVSACPSALPSGACCALDRTCSYVHRSACLDPSVWQGDWTTCSPNPCHPLGACCADDGSCALVPQDNCNWSYWHREWTSCSPNPCPQPMGACCYENGSCRLLLLQTDCPSWGVWHGEWASCSPNPCPPAGACCAYEGPCSMALQAHCPSPGVWHGEWTSCYPNPCPQPLGACCFLDVDSCTLQTQAECTGWWEGVGTHCYGTSCIGSGPPEGACCLADGSCTYVQQADCHGSWHEGLDCTAYQCLPPTGGCCTNGVCTQVVQSACSGTWLGVGVICNVTDCQPPVPVEHKSWGQVKHSYR